MDYGFLSEAPFAFVRGILAKESKSHGSFMPFLLDQKGTDHRDERHDGREDSPLFQENRQVLFTTFP